MKTEEIRQNIFHLLYSTMGELDKKKITVKEAQTISKIVNKSLKERYKLVKRFAKEKMSAEEFDKLDFDMVEKCLNDLLEFEFCRKELEELNKFRSKGKVIL